MQEHRVTVAKQQYTLTEPFFVLATQNPLEMEGTYPLPEAQLDRFFFKIDVPFPTEGELLQIMDRTTGGDVPTIGKAATGADVLAMQALARDVPIASHVMGYAVRVLRATHPDVDGAPELVRKYVRYGGSPRGAQAIVLGAKIHALLDARFNVAFADVQAVAPAALRHRIILNFEGEAEGISSDSVASHRRFAAGQGLSFLLLSDREGAVRALYGVAKTLGVLPGRVTYVIDAGGVVRHIYSSQLWPLRHSREALGALEELGRTSAWRPS